MGYTPSRTWRGGKDKTYSPAEFVNPTFLLEDISYTFLLRCEFFHKIKSCKHTTWNYITISVQSMWLLPIPAKALQLKARFPSSGESTQTVFPNNLANTFVWVVPLQKFALRRWCEFQCHNEYHVSWKLFNCFRNSNGEDWPQAHTMNVMLYGCRNHVGEGVSLQSKT
jgi:hypothetical protein